MDLRNNETMEHRMLKHLSLKFGIPALLIAIAAVPAWSQNCQTRDEIAPEVRSGIEAAAQKAFDEASRGDANALRADSIPSLQSNFASIAGAVNDNKAALAGATPQLRTSFLLDTGPTPSADGQFYCGVFGARGLGANGAEFDIPNLPVGKYGIAIQDILGSKGPYVLTTIFQDMSGWKIAGFRVHSVSAIGHDGFWYLQRAREYKTRGQTHNAWFYYLTSWELIAPVPFMNTVVLSKLTQESNSVQPKDVPVGGNPVAFSANGKTYNITEISPLYTGNTFDLNIKYSVPSTADFNGTQADARGLATAMVAQYPELKDAFTNVWAHAVDPNGAEAVGLINLKQAQKP
jgi:hypothetical protein